MDKSTLRKVYLEKRKMLSSVEYDRRNKLLSEGLIKFISSHNFKNVHVFLPIKQQKEFDTWDFINFIWQFYPDKNIITAVSDLKKPEMMHYHLLKSVKLAINKWGIPEPIEAKLFPVDRIDCVIVPMVIGSKSGHRIGYGKGYYDRFLQQCKQKTTFVGVSLAPLLEGDLFADQYDITMNYMLTPFKNYKI